MTLCGQKLAFLVTAVEPHDMSVYERRAHRRAPTWLRTFVKADRDDLGREGLVRDLSISGAAIEVTDWPAQENGTLELLEDGYCRLIPFEVVSAECTTRGTFLHVRFKAIEGPSWAYLTKLLVASAEEFAEWQRFLAERPDNLAS